MNDRAWWVDNVHALLANKTGRSADEDTKLLLCELIREVRNLRAQDESSSGMIKGVLGDTKIAWKSYQSLTSKSRRILMHMGDVWISELDESTLKHYAKNVAYEPCGQKTIQEILEWVKS